MKESSVSVFSRIALFLVVLLSVWLVILSRKERERSNGIETDIDRLKQEASSLKEENEALKEKIDYFSSDSFQEREAKEKLGYRKTDERVVVLRGEESEEGKRGEDAGAKSRGVRVRRSNWEQWLDLFR